MHAQTMHSSNGILHGSCSVLCRVNLLPLVVYNLIG
jgi:hypothetical protein